MVRVNHSHIHPFPLSTPLTIPFPETITTSVSATDALKPVIFADSLYFLNSTSQDFAQKRLTRTTRLYYHQRCTHFWSQIDGSGQLIKSRLGERKQDQYVEGINGQIQSHRCHR